MVPDPQATPPVVNINMDNTGRFAFVELRTEEMTALAVQMDKIVSGALFLFGSGGWMGEGSAARWPRGAGARVCAAGRGRWRSPQGGQGVPRLRFGRAHMQLPLGPNGLPTATRHSWPRPPAG